MFLSVENIDIFSYTFGGREGVKKKCTFCALVKMLIIVNGPLQGGHIEVSKIAASLVLSVCFSLLSQFYCDR